MSIRVHRAQGLHVDDYFLILAILCLIASFGFFMAIIPSLFLFNDVLAGLAPLPTNFLQLSVNTALGDAIGETMAWTAIYAVKLSFLFVFRTLVRRIRPLEILWLCTFIICIPTAGVSISATWIICPHPNINPLGGYRLLAYEHPNFSANACFSKLYWVFLTASRDSYALLHLDL